MGGVVRWWWSGLLLGLLCACEYVPEQGACTASVWDAEYTLSGGIAGVARQLTLDSTGRYSVHDRRSGASHSGEVGCEVVQEIAALYEAAGVPPQAPAGGFARRCADCLTQTLVWQGAEGKAVSVTVDGPELPTSPYRPLLERLQALMEQGL